MEQLTVWCQVVPRRECVTIDADCSHKVDRSHILGVVNGRCRLCPMKVSNVLYPAVDCLYVVLRIIDSFHCLHRQHQHTSYRHTRL